MSTYPGGCTCGEIRYQLLRTPMFVHCCHCRWCQRESGSAFVLNGLIESAEVEKLQGRIEVIETPTNSGRGQRIARCPTCRVAVWSHYDAAKETIGFVRIGTLDDPDRFPPDIHIFTASKQPWVTLDGGAPVCAEYYQRSAHWPAESVARYDRALGR